MLSERLKDKTSIDELVLEAHEADIHRLRGILFEVFMEGVNFARDKIQHDALHLRRNCFMQASDIFDIASPEEEHEARMKIR